MGRKDHAREVAIAAGVPVVPTGGADDIGYPVLVKAAAGGGGKGMRVVRSAAELAEATAAARREALTRVRRRHDAGREVRRARPPHRGAGHRRHPRHGRCTCSSATAPPSAATRRCSRRPRPPRGLRHRAPGDAGRPSTWPAQVGYVGAGTVEFLLDADTGDFYFLEMNTRLQVEHPVTEAVTGRRPGRAAAAGGRGRAARVHPGRRRAHGHAIEARVYAEDACGGFLPQAGTAHRALARRSRRARATTRWRASRSCRRRSTRCSAR